MSDLFSNPFDSDPEEYYKKLAEARKACEPKIIHFFDISVDGKSLVSRTEKITDHYSPNPHEERNLKINLLMPRKESGMLKSITKHPFRTYERSTRSGNEYDVHTKLSIHTFPQYMVLIEEEGGKIMDINVVDIEKLTENNTENTFDKYLKPKEELGENRTENCKWLGKIIYP